MDICHCVPLDVSFLKIFFLFPLGVLLIDEMQLVPGSYFNRETLKVEGFKDLGDKDLEETFGEEVQQEFEEAVLKLPSGDPRNSQKRMKKEEKNKNQKDKNLGDHGLVIQFQPFQGSWVQNLGCFLTKDAANDDELTKLVLEATILVEYSDFIVDGVVTDGAPWNRSMWKKFGISEDNVTAEHPCDPDRQLFFFSDYPHLLKCMRNCLVEKKKIEVRPSSFLPFSDLMLLKYYLTDIHFICRLQMVRSN